MAKITHTTNLNLTEYNGTDLPELYNNITEDNRKIDVESSDVREILIQHTEGILKNKNAIARNDADIKRLQDKDIEHDSSIELLENRMETAETDIQQNANDITELQEYQSEHTQEYTELKAQVDKNTEDIANSDIPSFLALETKVNTNAKNIADAQEDIRKLQERATSSEANITALGDRISINESDISNLKDCCDEVNNIITDLQRQITENDNDIADINTRLTNVTERVTAIETDMDTLATQIESNSDRITALEEAEIVLTSERVVGKDSNGIVYERVFTSRLASSPNVEINITPPFATTVKRYQNITGVAYKSNAGVLSDEIIVPYRKGFGTDAKEVQLDISTTNTNITAIHNHADFNNMSVEITARYYKKD